MKSKKGRKVYQSGQSLLELVLALGVMTLAVIAVVSVASIAVRNNNFSKNKTLASRYAQQATEWLRTEKDAGWPAFIANINSIPPSPDFILCLDNLSWAKKTKCGEGDLISGLFKREATFCTLGLDCSDPNLEQVPVTIELSWTDSRGLHKVRSATVFTNW